MKTLLIAGIALLSITGCSFVKDVQHHCKVSVTGDSIQTGSFTACLNCDSLAKVVYDNLQKKIQKNKP